MVERQAPDPQDPRSSPASRVQRLEDLTLQVSAFSLIYLFIFRSLPRSCPSPCHPLSALAVYWCRGSPTLVSHAERLMSRSAWELAGGGSVTCAYIDCSPYPIRRPGPLLCAAASQHARAAPRSGVSLSRFPPSRVKVPVPDRCMVLTSPSIEGDHVPATTTLRECQTSRSVSVCGAR